MTGPQHYEAAELILRAVEADPICNHTDDLAEAQVHATLALAAATADHAIGRVQDAWWQVLS